MLPTVSGQGDEFKVFGFYRPVGIKNGRQQCLLSAHLESRQVRTDQETDPFEPVTVRTMLTVQGAPSVHVTFQLKDGLVRLNHFESIALG